MTIKLQKDIRIIKQQRKTLLKRFEDKRNIENLIDQYVKTKEHKKKLNRIDDQIKWAITHIAYKNGVSIGYCGTLNPRFYKTHLENSDFPGLNFVLIKKGEIGIS